MNLQRLTFPQNADEAKALEVLDEYIPRMNKEELKYLILYTAYLLIPDDGEEYLHFVDRTDGLFEDAPEDFWEYHNNLICTYNCYTLIYVLAHQLIFPNGELEKVSA